MALSGLLHPNPYQIFCQDLTIPGHFLRGQKTVANGVSTKIVRMSGLGPAIPNGGFIVLFTGSTSDGVTASQGVVGSWLSTASQFGVTLVPAGNGIVVPSTTSVGNDLAVVFSYDASILGQVDLSITVTSGIMVSPTVVGMQIIAFDGLQLEFI